MTLQLFEGKSLQFNQISDIYGEWSADFKSGVSTIPPRPQFTDKPQQSSVIAPDLVQPNTPKQSQRVGTVAQLQAQRVIPQRMHGFSPCFQEESAHE